MNEFQSELLELRRSIVDSLRKELLGPGSEVSYPDEEHELISESPMERYSVGILYSQVENNKFNDNDEVKFVDNQEDIDVEDNGDSQSIDNENYFNQNFDDDRYEKSVQNNELDDEINMAQQNKPSSMGFTFFVSGDIDSFEITVKYAKYNVAQDDEIVIPCPDEIDNLEIPIFLSQYIYFDKNKRVIKKLEPINWHDLCELVDHNENWDDINNLQNIIANLNKVYRPKKAYRREPFEEHIVLKFEGNSAITDLANANGYISAVKHIVNANVCSITIMLVNNEKEKKNECIFQPVITVNSDFLNGLSFLSYNHFADTSAFSDDEKSLDLVYRNKLVYGTGHGVSVDWNIKNGKGEIFTEFMPIFEVPKINLNLRRDMDGGDKIDEKCLSMKYLSDFDKTDKFNKLKNVEIFIDSYGKWINSLKNESKNLEDRYKSSAGKHIKNCEESFKRMKYGISILKEDKNAWDAFQLTNRAMFMQRVHGSFQSKEIYPNDEEWQKKMSDLDYKDYPIDLHKWRPFQLAFLLMSVRSIVDSQCDERDFVDLIWFPTGGGKTEAYLGLTAFAIFYRRLLNPENGGTTVIMRYTLRLLTSQQFTRASTLICACEKIRKDEVGSKHRKYNLGKERITIGLWIGGDHVPNTNPIAKDDYEKLTRGQMDLKGRKEQYNKFQVLKCPWCGTKLVKELKDRKEVGEWGYKFHKDKYFYISCTQENCEFEKELPIQIIDEELYENPPTLLFGTVDKFAMMAWKGDIKSFFGKENNDAPDLIIQDELHLIAGPLGSMVGIYETAIDYLCSKNGKKPKIIASTATIRQADKQCRALYNREVKQFPAQGLDASDSFFAKEIPIKQDFGRLYLGIISSGKTKVMMQARATACVLQAVHELDCSEKERDQLYTLVIYFNSLKELGKASSVVSDDVKDFIKRITYRQIFKIFDSRNIGMPYELTSRVKTAELNDTLDKLEHLTYSEKNLADKKYPINVLLASNMISVGVDVSRLNLMFLQGQPKSVSEYIQASSRIGRTNPGLAVTLYDPSKSRDRSYYEQFKAFHSAFYKYVEPTGVTPFSSPSVDRAIHAVLISMIRQSIEGMNTNIGAVHITEEMILSQIKLIIDYIIDRVKSINSFNPEGMKDDSDYVSKRLIDFVNEWKEKAINNEDLVYGDRNIATDVLVDKNRIIKRFDDKNKDDAQRTLTSLRNVDKTVPASIIIWEDENE